MDRTFTKKTIQKGNAIRAWVKSNHPEVNQCVFVEPDVCGACYDLCEILSPEKKLAPQN